VAEPPFGGREGVCNRPDRSHGHGEQKNICHFLIFHDALSQWNQKEAQLHIKTRYPGFENRFIKPVGTTCAGTIYNDMPPGNSPENARGLDSFGFADLEYAMCFNCALAWHCPYGNHRRIFCAVKPSSAFPPNKPTGLRARVSRLGGFTRPLSG
jgi:hypothetical protein